MKKEFITAVGKVIVDDEHLLVKNLKERSRNDQYRYLIWLLLGISIISEGNKIKFMAYILVGLCGLILLGYLVEFFSKNQWKSRFRISRIKGIKAIPDEFGLETKVILFFRSNTTKEILFRTSENQHTDFVQYIEQQITHAQFA